MYVCRKRGRQYRDRHGSLERPGGDVSQEDFRKAWPKAGPVWAQQQGTHAQVSDYISREHPGKHGGKLLLFLSTRSDNMTWGRISASH